MEEESRPEVYIIPTNVTDNGNVLNGNIKKKNAYECAAIIAIGIFVCFLVLSFLPAIPRVIIFTIFLLLGGFAIVGFRGESLVEYILEVSFFKRKRRTMKYRLPRKEVEQKRKRLKRSAARDSDAQP